MVALQDYNLGLHIGSVFILLGVSAAGALLPVALHISSKSSTVLAIVKLGTFFGAWPADDGCRVQHSTAALAAALPADSAFNRSTCNPSI